MISIIPGTEVSKLDKKFIQSKNISSVELMEKAAEGFCDWFRLNFQSLEQPIFIFCGPGNNGGDGLAIARILAQSEYRITVISLKNPSDCSSDFQDNYKCLPDAVLKIGIKDFEKEKITPDAIVIDGVLGVGINRELSGSFKKLIQDLNELKSKKIAIDIPTGIPSDDVLAGEAFKADYTITFQFPKLSLLFPEHAKWTGEIEVVDIGISENLLNEFGQDKFFLQEKDIAQRHLTFHSFSHKGDFGRVMFIGGSKGKMGSIILSSKAALRTGSGLVVCHPPESEILLVQILALEIMVETELIDLEKYDAIGIGPGWGTEISATYYREILLKYKKPVVIDADGLNLIAKNPSLLHALPKNSILTPHLKEFERLVGPCENHLTRIQKAKDFSMQHQCIIVLKGAYTSISLPDGNQIFNAMANPYMATAGSGDVLTGMITSFLGQGYSSENAAICGVFHHGLAGKLASVSKRRGTIATDILDKIPDTFEFLEID